MTYSLDANTCIEHLRGVRKGNLSPVSSRLRSENQNDVVICSIVRAELLYGAEKSASREAALAETRQFLAAFPTAAFDDAAAEEYGRIRCDLEVRARRSTTRTTC